MVTHLGENEQSKEIYITEGSVYVCLFQSRCHMHVIAHLRASPGACVLLRHCLSLRVLMLQQRLSSPPVPDSSNEPLSIPALVPSVKQQGDPEVGTLSSPPTLLSPSPHPRFVVAASGGATIRCAQSWFKRRQQTWPQAVTFLHSAVRVAILLSSQCPSIIFCPNTQPEKFEKMPLTGIRSSFQTWALLS